MIERKSLDFVPLAIFDLWENYLVWKKIFLYTVRYFSDKNFCAKKFYSFLDLHL